VSPPGPSSDRPDRRQDLARITTASSSSWSRRRRATTTAHEAQIGPAWPPPPQEAAAVAGRLHHPRHIASAAASACSSYHCCKAALPAHALESTSASTAALPISFGGGGCRHRHGADGRDDWRDLAGGLDLEAARVSPGSPTRSDARDGDKAVSVLC
jgi:hypothetical protein